MAISRSLVCCLVLLTLGIVVGLIAILVLFVRVPESPCPGGYQHAAVAADAPPCSDIGRDILKRGGSAVDSAIAALLCCSVLNPQSMGLGGGVIFTIYNASTGVVEVINARETAPEGTPANLMSRCKQPSFNNIGPTWIGVPGELRGYEAAHRRHGKLPWRTLFEPTIKLVSEGFQVPVVLNLFLNSSMLKRGIMNSSVCDVYCKDGDVMKAGHTLKIPKLAETLRMVADHGADVFYNGILAERMVQDIRKAGGRMTLEDLKNFNVEIVPALNVSLGDYTLYTPPPPAGGPILSFILNILKGYKFGPDSVKGKGAKIETYHRIIEALKFANGQKSKIRDHWARESKQVIDLLMSDSFADLARSRIDDSGNHNLSYYNISHTAPEGPGTTHLSVIAKDGSAVSVTSTINYPFGSMIYSPQTGIILNNELADFCKMRPGSTVSNGERPPSAMTPAILISRDKTSKFVIGGAGGDMIISATALTIMNKIWFGYDLGKAISTGTIYVDGSNKLYSEDAQKNAADFHDVRQGLEAKGHRFSSMYHFMNVVQAVAKEGRCVYGESDKRKLSRAAGY
ncbi:glutathione hydrolase 5 proenzyme [Ambystoma mexicanum]|uniref:glutathione hydrolase 5 proenzyme n=1 Tax=Ambystoma mexicanum TaxID=8296 RepID=UPI0037E97376